MKRAVVVVLILLLASLACGSASDSNGSQSSNNDSSSQVEEMSALEIAALAFEGNYTEAQIKVKLDQVLRLYDMPLTEKNYTDLSDMVVTVRTNSETGITEMDILQYMIDTGEPPENMTLREGLALAWSFLETENELKAEK